MQEKKIVINKNGYLLTFCEKSFSMYEETIWYVISFGAKGRKIKQYLSRAVHENGKSYSISFHRELLGLKNKDTKIVDHINGDGLDNRLCNLRLCSRAQNAQNRNKTKNKCESKYLGVTFNKRKGIKKPWYASVQSTELDIVIRKSFSTELEAATFRDKVAKLIFGEFSKLNFP